MSRIITDDECKAFIRSFYTLIENALQAGRSHMEGRSSCRPEIVDGMLALVESIATRGQEYKWPDPGARLAEAASSNAALQKLIKRASKPTPIRAVAKEKKC